MEHFFALPLEKRNKIINAALYAFGKKGYKKASINDIASGAGVSKSIMFHYFGTKKNLYFYLVDYGIGIIMNELEKEYYIKEADFFKRIRTVTMAKVAALKEHPSLLIFLTGMYYETDKETSAEIKNILSKGAVIRNKILFDDMDAAKFKDGIDSGLVYKMIGWLTDGYLNELPDKTELDIDIILKDFFKCLDLLEKNLYREDI